MYFLNEYLLILLLIPSLFFVLSFLNIKNRIDTIFSKEMLEILSLNHQVISPTLRYRLFILALSLFIIALARPVKENKGLKVKEMKSSAVIALDVSKSMKQTDIYPSRLTLAKEKLLSIIKSANKMNIGVLIFAKDAYMLYPVSEDLETLEFMLKNADIKRVFKPNSNLFSALQASKYMLRAESSKNIILLSDGAANVSREEELKYLKKNNLKLFSIGITEKSNFQIKDLSKKSGGLFREYSWGNTDVKEILQEIKNNSQTKSVSSYEIKNYNEYFTYPLALAVFLLLVIFMSSFKRESMLKLSLLLALMQLLSSTPANAGVFDFWTLREAKILYDEKKYKQSAKSYKKIASNPTTYYNLAGALYMSKDYLEAIRFYKKALGKDSLLNAKIYHNIANSYVQRDKLDVAKEYFVKSLKAHTFTQTQENLKIITQELKKRKKLLAKDTLKIQFKNRLKQQQEWHKISSSYSVKLEDLLLSDEEKWMKLIQNQKTPLFLQKIKTTRMSLDAQIPN